MDQTTLVHTLTNPWLLAATCVLLLVYKCVIQHWNFFSNIGVKFERGWPILGTQYEFFMGKLAINDVFLKLYKKYPNDPVIGIYDIGGDPSFLIRDLDLIKKITSKDFDHFANRRIFIDKDTDPLIGRSMFITRDQPWKEGRSTVSPAFTGSKMRLMMQLVNECSVDFCDYIKQSLKNDELTLDIKDVFSRFVANSIATSAFGVKIDTLKNRNEEFYKQGYSLTNLDGVQALKFVAFSNLPKLMKFLNIKMLRKEDADYFRKMIQENMKYRQEHNIHRPDMINLMMEARNGKLKHDAIEDDIGFATAKESDIGRATRKQLNLTEDDLVAQCMIFIFGGFSAVPATQSFLAHALATNPDIQAKLYEEVKAVNENLSGKTLTYEILQGMKYMDMVVSEVLRRHAISTTDRTVNKDYILEDKNGKKIKLKAGDGILIPISAVHMDEKYFPNPEKFDPERFSEENKKNIVPGSYMPFGAGPRNCVGSRFALLEIKVLYFYLILNFRLDVCEKTQQPLQYKKKATLVDADSFWVKMSLRGGLK